MKTIEIQTEQFAKSVAEKAPVIAISGKLLHALAENINVDPTKASEEQKEVVTAIANTLPVAGKGKRKVSIGLSVAAYLVSGLASPVPDKPTETEATKTTRKKG